MSYEKLKCRESNQAKCLRLNEYAVRKQQKVERKLLSMKRESSFVVFQHILIQLNLLRYFFLFFYFLREVTAQNLQEPLIAVRTI